MPYKSIHERMGTDHETRVWWGVEKLWTLVQKFKETTQRQYKDVCVSVYAIKIFCEISSDHECWLLREKVHNFVNRQLRNDS